MTIEHKIICKKQAGKKPVRAKRLHFSCRGEECWRENRTKRKTIENAEPRPWLMQVAVTDREEQIDQAITPGNFFRHFG
jgi:hypothetical protein